MMDQKYLSEIRARERVATPGPWPRDGSIFAANGINNCDFIAAARTDIPALIAEVERLTIENLGLKDAAIRCDGYEKRYHAALTELDTKDQQIATLKKALEYACADRATTPSMWQDLQKKYMEIAHQAQEREGKK